VIRTTLSLKSTLFLIALLTIPETATTAAADSPIFFKTGIPVPSYTGRMVQCLGSFSIRTPEKMLVARQRGQEMTAHG
jgi:hypothetical protein